MEGIWFSDMMDVYHYLGVVYKLKQELKNMKKRVGIIGGGASAGGCYRSSPKRGGSDCHRTYGPRGKKRSFLQATAGVILPITKWKKTATAAAGRIFLCR